MTTQPGTRLVLLCGLPGSGKTTLARQLETELAAVRLCPDDWLNDLGVDLNDEPTRDRLELVFWTLAQRLLELGQSVILESGFWLRSDRDEKRLGARALGVGVELCYLRCASRRASPPIGRPDGGRCTRDGGDDPRADKCVDPSI
jgi:predicted kinase